MLAQQSLLKATHTSSLVCFVTQFLSHLMPLVGARGTLDSTFSLQPLEITMCRLRDCGLNPWPEPAFVGQMQPEHMLSRKVCASSLRRRRNLTVVEAKKKSFKPRNRQAAAGASHAEVRREQHEHVCTWISDTVYACMCVHMCVRASIYACLYMSLCRSQCI